MSRELPRQIGPYRPAALLADGALACSYRVHPPVPGATPRILKTMLPSRHVDPETLQRFRREVVIQMGIHHPNVWEVVDYGFWGEDVPYVVMDDLGQRTLADELREDGPRPLPRWHDVMRQVLSGLEAIHQAGAVHRGLAVDRVLVAPDGSCKIFDFAFSSRNGLADLTPLGVSVGVVETMAPEQLFDAHRADARADLFSLGVVGFHLLTGHFPVETPDVVQRVSRLAHGEFERIERWRPDLPGAVVAWLDRLLLVPREQRFADAAAALQALGPGGPD